ncbi:MAG: M28 family peptidase, partial [Spirochaetaceae bacterium]|nr:M28 family peptidase [Spirochaetaceae bacterium]
MNSRNDSVLSQLPLPSADRIELKNFCSENADRKEILLASLKRRNIPFDIIPLEGAYHIALPVPRAGKMDGEYFRVTLVAHYDRVEGTPGANDNAASVFQLLNHWEEITRLGWNHRTQILFTDKEELTGDMAATDQGSWLLAKHLKRLGAKNILFFVLDMCGIGD